MTSASVEHPAKASSSIELRQAVRFTAPAIFVGLGSFIAWQAPTLPFGIALFLLAILSANLSDRRGYSILVTVSASVCLAIPYLLASALPNPVQVLWFACLWIAAALLSWDSTRSITMDRLEDAFAVSPNGLLLANLGGEVIHANRAVKKLLNASTVNAAGTEIQNLIGLEIWHHIQSQITDGVESLTVEFEVQTTDRRRMPEGHVNQIRNHRDKPAYYVIQLDDITEAQSTNQALNLATYQLKQILGVSTDVVFILDSRLNVTYANNRALQLLKITAPNLHKQPIADHVANTQSRGFLESIRAFRKGKERLMTLDAVQFKSQHDHGLNVEIVRLGNSSDAGFALVCHPAEDLVNSLYTLKTSQARFSQVFHASPDAILIMRAQDRLILDFNEGFTRLLGYRREDAIGVLETDLDFWSSVIERGAVSEQLIADREVIDYETTLKTVGGSLAHIEISIRYIEVDNELCILWIGRDITKRISAEPRWSKLKKNSKRSLPIAPMASSSIAKPME